MIEWQFDKIQKPGANEANRKDVSELSLSVAKIGMKEAVWPEVKGQKSPPRCWKSHNFVPPSMPKIPHFLVKKSHILRYFFWKFDPSYNFYCIFMHKFFSNFKKLVNFF